MNRKRVSNSVSKQAIQAKLQRKKVKTIISNSIIVIVQDVLQHIKCFPFLHAFLLNPSNFDFASDINPGLWV